MTYQKANETTLVACNECGSMVPDAKRKTHNTFHKKLDQLQGVAPDDDQQGLDAAILAGFEAERKRKA